MKPRIERLEKTIFGCNRSLRKYTERRDIANRSANAGQPWSKNFLPEVARYDAKLAGIRHTLEGSMRQLQELQRGM